MHIIEPPKPDKIKELEFHGSDLSGRLHIELLPNFVDGLRDQAAWA